MSDTFQQLLITLGLLAEDPGEADLAPIGAVGRGALEARQPGGYVVRFPYTRERGGEFLVEINITFTTITRNVWAHVEGVRSRQDIQPSRRAVRTNLCPLREQCYIEREIRQNVFAHIEPVSSSHKSKWESSLKRCDCSILVLQ